ncbi:MAG: 4-(cytidine 5'-diphospho)-2-C-methyl-D-erythritol kinase [Rhodospirillales bacterium]|nr:4-(cytidine 5'-diphospho)-2-C-methyl-D-erythritol kinase [Rhodospirillales bacterium]
MAAPAAPRIGPDQDPITLPAPAKLNLYLHVTGRRADGYHLLDSLVAFAGVHDAIEVSPADDLSLAVEGPFAAALPAADDNLVLKATRALRAAAGVSAGARIRLEKWLPVASGIGGGSADAAAVLGALMRLWSLDAKAVDLDQLALGLGADVPVCLKGYAAFVGGVGEEITRAPALPPAWLVLVNPGTALKTAAVFKARRGEFGAPARFDESPATAKVLAELLATRQNQLTAAAVGLAPEIGVALAALAAADGVLLARMSGSGATCFGLFAEAGLAAAAAALIGRDHPGWWVRATPLIADVRALAP